MEPNDHELISRAQQGEHAAFEALVYRYDQKVLSIAASYTSDPEDAKDIYQEVFLRVYRSLGGFQFRSQFSTWLYRIVSNVCLTHQMRKKNFATTSFDSDLDQQLSTADTLSTISQRPIAPDRYAQNREIWSNVQDAMELLSPQQRLVFTLKHEEGYKLREIAEMMDCGEGTVKKYLFTATEKLRKRLKKVFK